MNTVTQQEADQVLRTLASMRETLTAHAVRSVSVFGSVIRGQAGPGSDIDVLVEFEPDAHVGLFAFVRLRRVLEEQLGRPVDLVTPEALHPRMREQILNEAVRAA
jgi:uncharacterized protein